MAQRNTRGFIGGGTARGGGIKGLGGALSLHMTYVNVTYVNVTYVNVNIDFMYVQGCRE